MPVRFFPMCALFFYPLPPSPLGVVTPAGQGHPCVLVETFAVENSFVCSRWHLPQVHCPYSGETATVIFLISLREVKVVPFCSNWGLVLFYSNIF